jgi:hypothetical protein
MARPCHDAGARHGRNVPGPSAIILSIAQLLRSSHPTKYAYLYTVVGDMGPPQRSVTSMPDALCWARTARQVTSGSGQLQSARPL